MSRRRAQKQQEKEQFIDENPELARYVTHIEVVEAENHSDLNNAVGFVVPQAVEAEVLGVPVMATTQYEAQATQNGEEVFARTFTTEVFPDLTTAFAVDTAVGQLSAGLPIGGPGQPKPAPQGLSLSEDGFGVAEQDFGGPQVAGLNGGWDDYRQPSEDYALDGDEVIVFETHESYDSRDGDFETGATSFGIDYTVLSGRGTVEIVLLDFDAANEEAGTVEATSAFLRAGDTGSLDAEMDQQAYEVALIRVTGNLEIALVGIDVTTNTQDFVDFS